MSSGVGIEVKTIASQDLKNAVVYYLVRNDVTGART
jgi:hypothetical protein